MLEAPKPSSPLGRHVGYHFVDYVTQFYAALIGLLIVLFHNNALPHWQWLVAAHATCVVGIHALIRIHATAPRNRILDFLRYFYPILLYTGFYRETGVLNHVFTGHYFDGIFMRLEEGIFGFQPSVSFMARLPHLPVSELFYVSYFSYYVMIAGVGLALYFQGRERFFHFVTVTSAIFYVCYLTYIFMPVLGPLVFREAIPGFPGQSEMSFFPLAYPEAVQSGPFFRIMKFIYVYFESRGAAFPSSHVAVATCTLYFSWRYIPRIRYAHLVAVILLSLSTVYCRYHYGIDVPAGILATAILLPITNHLYKKLRRTADPLPPTCNDGNAGST